MSFINFWQLLAGLGLFLFAMKQLEQALANLGSHSFRELLKRHTQTPVRSILSGTLATTIVQSSSLVGLFTLALAGAGMLELRNAVGIIVGANLGTTITGWLVATLGFKLSLTNLSLPLIAVGSLGLTLRSDRGEGWRFALAIGLLLFGLDYMKVSVDALQQQFDITRVQALHPLWMFLIGAVFSAIIQSSSGTMVITLSALNAGIIDLSQSAALIIGADLGTTSTLILGGLPGSQLQRQIAAAHFFFNLIIDLIALAALPGLLWLVTTIYGLENYPLLALVAIHSSFNFAGILLFLPLITRFADWLQRLFPQAEEFPLQTIPARASDIGTEALERASRELILTVIDLNRHCFKIPEDSPITHFSDVYDSLKNRELDILMLAQRMQAVGVSGNLTERINCAVQSSREALMAAKEIKDIREQLIRFRHHTGIPIQDIDKAIREYQRLLYRQLGNVILHIDSASARELLMAVEADIRHQHVDVHQAIMPLLSSDELKTLSPALLNINREIFLSNLSLFTACKTIAVPEYVGRTAQD